MAEKTIKEINEKIKKGKAVTLKYSLNTHYFRCIFMVWNFKIIYHCENRPPLREGLGRF